MVTLRFIYRFGEGWLVSDNKGTYRLKDSTINFVNEDTTHAVSLSDNMAFFNIEVKNFDHARKPRLNAAHGYGIIYKKHKCDRFASMALYLPFKAVDLELMKSDYPKTIDESIFDIFHYTFNGKNLGFIYDDKMHTMRQVSPNRITIPQRIFRCYTESQQALIELSKDLSETANVNIDTYTLKQILKHYTIIKKQEKKEASYEKNFGKQN